VSTDNPSNSPVSYTFSEQVGHLLRKAYQRHLAIFQQNVGDSQLTAVQFVTLCALRDHGPSSQTELVKATAVDQATIRGIVDRLKAPDRKTAAKSSAASPTAACSWCRRPSLAPRRSPN
jgi:hypothetical protein